MVATRASHSHLASVSQVIRDETKRKPFKRFPICDHSALGELVYAASGLGCFLNGVRVRVSTTSTLQALLLCTDFGVCGQYGFAKAAEALQQKVRTCRTWGDAYGYVLVATGRADIMLDPVMNVWDCAALLPILEEAGGTFTDWGGNRTINGGNALATNRLLFDDVMELIRNPAVSDSES